MAKKPLKLSCVDIILGADAEVIRQAYESRLKIDGLLDERLQAYEQIHRLETQIEELVGIPGYFMYPAPPVPVSGYPKVAAAAFPVAAPPAPPKKPKVPDAPKVEDDMPAEKNDGEEPSE